jgi:uroporphyrinogen-III decarboxylase
MHFHGWSMEAAADFAEIGADCVCPFERGPGGDVDGLEGLRRVRALLRDRVAFNGNVLTVETLIRGTPGDVRREVGEIREAFRGSARFIVGTGDQVGVETPEENIVAMIEEAKRP